MICPFVYLIVCTVENFKNDIIVLRVSDRVIALRKGYVSK